MRRFAKVAALAVAATMLFAPVASAQDPCSGTIGGAEGTPVLERGTVVDIGGAYYLDFREVAGVDFLFSIWVYQESNGVAGLQRGNDGAPPPEPIPTIYSLIEGLVTSSIDPCEEAGVADTIIF